MNVQGVQALTQQVLRLYGIGFAIILGKPSSVMSEHVHCATSAYQQCAVPSAVCAELEWERFLVTFKVRMFLLVMLWHAGLP